MPFSRQHEYEAGDTVVYMTGSGECRTVRVIEKSHDINGYGAPGFDGVPLSLDPELRCHVRRIVWGYDDQITEIRRAA